ncbi:hypothetical protein BV20DRAFT_625934 [Pilatotrama ljubarskyi]|nr:hypothetical protein BV20DRAFT_625934 [Pilatotrama ljubarskyi]
MCHGTDKRRGFDNRKGDKNEYHSRRNLQKKRRPDTMTRRVGCHCQREVYCMSISRKRCVTITGWGGNVMIFQENADIDNDVTSCIVQSGGAVPTFDLTGSCRHVLNVPPQRWGEVEPRAKRGMQL